MSISHVVLLLMMINLNKEQKYINLNTKHTQAIPTQLQQNNFIPKQKKKENQKGKKDKRNENTHSINTSSHTLPQKQKNKYNKEVQKMLIKHTIHSFPHHRPRQG